MTGMARIGIWNDLFASVAEEMGETLGRSAMSPNIKERRDHSCAIFDQDGHLVSQAAHIPVHLGSLRTGVRNVLSEIELTAGDVVVFNDPYIGGTHLPDVSMISAVYFGSEIIGYVASKAHQSDIGGSNPSSMGLANHISDEGILIPPAMIVLKGDINPDVFEPIMSQMLNREEREGDFQAQIGAHKVGEMRLSALAKRYGIDKFRGSMDDLIQYSNKLAQSLIAQIPSGEYFGSDLLDDDGFGNTDILIRCRVVVTDGQVLFDFSGSSAAVEGPLNAPKSVTESAAIYVLKCILGASVPMNEGLMRRVKLITEPGSIVDAQSPSAVAAANVETSQRVVDTIFRALAPAMPEVIPAASSGGMNNVSISFERPDGTRMSYYETIGGGAGAGSHYEGESGIQTHMTNTMNTPVEALEMSYPLRIRRYEIRSDSGGRGKNRGGNGVTREYEFLAPARIALLTERRARGPWGLNGGLSGSPGFNRLITSEGEYDLAAKVVKDVNEGDILSITTPGGGGWGKSDNKDGIINGST